MNYFLEVTVYSLQMEHGEKLMVNLLLIGLHKDFATIILAGDVSQLF